MNQDDLWLWSIYAVVALVLVLGHVAGLLRLDPIGADADGRLRMESR